MKKRFLIVFVVLMIAGAIVSAFSDVPEVDAVGLAVTFGSAGALCATTINKSEKKDWKTYVSLILLAIGCFGLGFLGVATDIMSAAISGIAGIIAIILGIITSPLFKQKSD